MGAVLAVKPDEKKSKAKAPSASITIVSPKASAGASAGMPRFLQSGAKAPAESKSSALVVMPSSVAEGAAAAGEGSGVVLLMPPPPASISANTRARLHRSSVAAASSASAHAHLPKPVELRGSAHVAVTVPAEHQAGLTQSAVAKTQAGVNVPDPEIEKLCADIRGIIEGLRPKKDKDLVDAQPKDMAEQAEGKVRGNVSGAIDTVKPNYTPLLTAPTTGQPVEGGQLETPPSEVASPPLQAASATPEPIPAANVSLDADAQASQKSMDDAGMNSPEAQLIQTGPIAEARGEQTQLEEVAQVEPKQILLNQSQVLASTQADMAALQHGTVTALSSSRKTTVTGVGTQQQGMVGSEQQMLKDAGVQANTIFVITQTAVSVLLENLPRVAMAMWDQASDAATKTFRSDLREVEERIEKRHSGWLRGTIHRIGDWWHGMPDWVREKYTVAERHFGDTICNAAREISNKVNGIVATCHDLIKGADTAIAGIYSRLPASVGKWAQEEQDKFRSQLSALSKRVVQTKDKFTHDLVERAKGAVTAVHDEVNELREKSRGILTRIGNAVGRFIKDAAKYIINGLLDLVGISPDRFWSLVDKIAAVIGDIARHPLRFAGNLLSAIGKGFGLFFDHFTDHLIHGFVDWLTGGLAGAGVALPKDFSLPSVITFFFQLMGLTWEFIEGLIAKRVGPKNVALVKKVYGVVSTFIEKGPAGIFEMIKNRFNPADMLDQIIRAAVKFVMETLVVFIAKKILMLFNPVGAIIEAIKAIYSVLRWIFVNAARIFALVETVVDGMADIVAGNLDGMAKAVETALAGLIAPVIDFLADYMDLGGLPGKVRETIVGFRTWIEGLLDPAIGWLVEQGKSLLKMVGLGPAAGPVAGAGAEHGKIEHTKQENPDAHVGADLGWEADGEHHHLWIVTDGDRCIVMMASNTISVEDQLKSYRVKADKLTGSQKKKVHGKIDEAQQELDKLDKEAAKLAKDERKPSSKPKKATATGNAVVPKEAALARILREIQEALGLKGKWGRKEENPIPLNWQKRRLAAYPVLYFGPHIKTDYSDGIPQTLLREASLEDDPKGKSTKKIIERLRESQGGEKDSRYEEEWKLDKWEIHVYVPTQKRALPHGGPKIGVDGSRQLDVGMKIEMTKSGKSNAGDTINDPLRRYGFRPAKDGMDGDHVLERQMGGEDELWNLWPLDSTENQAGGRDLYNMEFKDAGGNVEAMKDLEEEATKSNPIWFQIRSTKR